MTAENKKINELTKSDLVEVLREGNKWETRKYEYLSTHLGIAVENIVVVTGYLTKYEQIIQLAIFDDYIKQQGLTINFALEIDGNHRHPFEYTDMEIGKGKNIKVIDSGYIFMTHSEGWPIVLHCSEWAVDRFKVKLHVKGEQQGWAIEFFAGWKKYAETHNVLRGKKINPAFRYLDLKEKYTWDSIILPEKLKAELQRNIDLLFSNIEVYKKNGLTFKRGLILKGVPGTGKTLIGKILCATLTDVTFIWVTPGHLTESSDVKTVCEMARSLAPAVLFLEDVDLYGGHRERENRSILGELMNQLDGLIANQFVVVIATTNRAEELEEALRNRPGRFDRVIEILKPDIDCRRKMLELHLLGLNLAIKNAVGLMERLAERTDGFTGAHIRELVNSAVISAIDEKSLDAESKVILRPSHFLKNIERVKAQKINPVGFEESQKKAPKFRDFPEDDEADWSAIDEEYGDG